MLDVRCPECDKRYRLRDDMEGEVVVCKDCDTPFDASTGRRVRRGSGSSTGIPPMAIYAAVGGVSLLIVIMVAWSIFSGGDEQQQPDQPLLAQNNPPPPIVNNQIQQAPVNPPNNQNQIPIPGVDPNKPAIPPILPFEDEEEKKTKSPLEELDDPEKPLAEWKVLYDPPADLSVIEPKKKIDLKVPSKSATDVVYPTANLLYAAIGDLGGRGKREVFDLRTNRKLGEFSGGTLFNPKSALSADGMFFAASNSTAGSTGIVVWEVKSGKVLGELPISTKWGSVEFLDFAGPHLIAIARDEPVRVWELPSGDLKKAFPLGAKTLWLRAEDFAVSPGGKYLYQIVNDTRVRVWAIPSGEIAGEFLLPDTRRFGYSRSQGLTFSPDGKELAGLFSGSTERILIYDVASGKLMDDIELKYEDDSINRHFGVWYRHRPLEWFPSGQRFLVKGHGIVDRVAGGPIWVAPEDRSGSSGPRRMISDERILVVTGIGNSLLVSNQPVPEDAIQAALKVKASGGQQFDVDLPPLTKTDVTAMLKVPATGAALWTLKPELLGSANAAKLVDTMNLKGGTGQLRGLYLGHPESLSGLVWYTNAKATAVPFKEGNFPPPSNKPDGPLWVERYDLASGKLLGAASIPLHCVPFHASPSGKLIVTHYPDEKERLDVWKVEDGTPFCAFRPYQQEDRHSRKVEVAVFIDDSHLLTREWTGKITCWTIPDCKAVYRIEQGGAPFLSPNYRVLTLSHVDRLRFVDALTGKVVGELETGGNWGVGNFNLDGTKLAGTVNADGDFKVVVWNTQTGAIELEFPVPRFHMRSLEWTGANHILLDGEYLVDLKQKAVAWRYKLPVGFQAPSSPDGRHWFLSAKSPSDKQISMTGLTLPHKEIAEDLSVNPIEDESIVREGTRVGLKVQLSAGGDPGLAQQVEQHFRNEIARRKFVLDPTASYVFQIGLEQSSTGKTQEYTIHGGGAGTQSNSSVSETLMTCKVTLTSAGQVVWDRSASFSNTSLFVNLEEGQSLQDKLNKDQQAGASFYLKSFRMPSKIFPANAGMGRGISNLIPGGAEKAR